MTIRFLRDCQGYSSGSEVSTFSAAQENLIIAAGAATRTLGSQQLSIYPSANAAGVKPANNPVMLSSDGSSLVSGDGSRLALNNKAGRIARLRWGRELSTVAATALTLQQAWTFPFDVYGWRFGFESNNSTTSPISLMKYGIVGSAGNTRTQAIDAMTDLELATPVSVTFNGAVTGTIPAYQYSGRPCVPYWSDWCYGTLLAGQTLGARVLRDGAAVSPIAATGLTNAQQLATSLSYIMSAWNDTTDRVTGWINWGTDTSNANQNLPIPFIELLTSRRMMSVAAVGDSTFTGTVDSGTPSMHPVVLAADSVSSSSLGVVGLCRGWSGKGVYSVTGTAGALGYYNLAVDLIANSKIDVLIYEIGSQNDTMSAAYPYQAWAYAQDVLARCKVAGIVPILATQIPLNTESAGDTTNRTILNALARNSGERVLDLDLVLSDGASPARYQSAYGSGTHPNLAAYTAIVTAYATAISSAAGSLM